MTIVCLALCGCEAGAVGDRGPEGAAGEAGATGEPGEPGAPGGPGEPGEAAEPVSISELAVGDVNCPQGGTAFMVGEDLSYACNGGPATTAGREDSIMIIGIAGANVEFDGFDRVGIGVEVMEIVSATGEVTYRAGASSNGNITLKRGLFEPASALLDVNATGQTAAIDVLLIINRATSATLLEFTVTRATVPDIEVVAGDDGVWIETVTIAPGQLSLASAAPTVRDGDGRIRVSTSAGIWGTFDVMQLPGRATGRPHKPVTLTKRVDQATPHWADVLDVMQNGSQPALLTVEVLDANDTVVQRFQLQDAWPSELQIKQNPAGGLLEEISIVTTGVTAM